MSIVQFFQIHKRTIEFRMNLIFDLKNIKHITNMINASKIG